MSKLFWMRIAYWTLSIAGWVCFAYSGVVVFTFVYYAIGIHLFGDELLKQSAWRVLVLTSYLIIMAPACVVCWTWSRDIKERHHFRKRLLGKSDQ